MAENNSCCKRAFFYVVCLLLALIQLQCKSQDMQAAKSDIEEDLFRPTLIIDSCIAEHQYEGVESKNLMRIEVKGNNQSIPQWAFAIVPSLMEVRLSPSVHTIEDNAFFSCKLLSRINLSNVDTIGENSFKNTAIEEINLSNAKLLKEFAFANCTSLRTVKLSNTLDSIGDFAFSGDTALVSCYFPAGHIGAGAFMGCSRLEEISFGKVLSIGKAAFLGCRSLTHVVIPSAMKSIGKEAFVGCENLKEAIICSPNTEIADGAFDNNVIIIYKNRNNE